MYQKISQARIMQEELKNCKTWEEFQWIMLCLRLVKATEPHGILI